MRLTRAQSQERTHERLLRAGHAVFLRRGFLAATVEEVAAEAGYTRGAVYKHFGGKEGLWHALVLAHSEAVAGHLRGQLESAASRDELLARLDPGPAVADPDTARWAVVAAEALAALGAARAVPEQRRISHVERVAEVQRRFDAEMVAVLADCCRRLRLRPVIPLPQVVVAWGALGAGLALRQALDAVATSPSTAAGVLGALLPPAPEENPT